MICECNNHELENDLRSTVGDVFIVKLNGECWGRSSLDLSSREKRQSVLRHLMEIPHDDCTTGKYIDLINLRFNFWRKRNFWQKNCQPAKTGKKLKKKK